MYVYVCIYVCIMYVFMYVCMYVYMYVCMCVCMHICMCMPIHSQSIHQSASVKFTVQPQSHCVTNLPSRPEVEPQFYRLSSPQPSHCTDRATELSRLLVRLLTLRCHSEYEFQRKCQARIGSVCHPRAVRCEQPHINLYPANVENWVSS
jgi:hypothetical protein